MNSYLRQSTASQSRALGPFVSDTDFKTVQTGLTIANTDVKLVVNGGASANKNSGGGTHRVNGVYGVTFDATDTATVGEMQVSVVVAGALAVFTTFVVLEETVYDALFAASAPGYLQPTTAGRTLDVSAGGEAGLDWANIGSPTTTQNLSGTSTKAVEPTVAGRTLDISSTGEAGLDWNNIGSPTTAQNLSGTSTKALEPTVAARKLDVSAGGEAGVDWANIGSPTTVVGLSGTTIKTATDVETDTADIQSRLPAALVSGRIDASVGAMAANTLTASALAADAVTEIQTGLALETTAQAIKTKTDNLPTDPADESLIIAATDAIQAAIAALNNLSAAQVNAEIVDALATDTYAEPAGVPAATASLATKLGRIHQALRNGLTVTASDKTFTNDAGTPIWKKPLSDDGSTYTEGEGTNP